MEQVWYYQSPLGKILLSADKVGLTGLWFQEHRYYAHTPEAAYEERQNPVLEEAEKWLDLYFAGHDPGFVLPLHLKGSSFQMEVWEILKWIPYGQLMTYGEIAKILEEKRGITRMSAQAVGGAVGHNPVSIVVPCHRVIGARGNLTGYGGGMERKIALLQLEGAWQDTFYSPKRKKQE